MVTIKRKNRQKDKQTKGQTDRRTKRQKDKQTKGQTDKRTDKTLCRKLKIE